MPLLNSNFEENTLNIDSDDYTTLEINSLSESFVSTNEFVLPSSGSNSELNSESHFNSEEQPKNSSHSSLFSDSSSDVIYPTHEVLLCQGLAASVINYWIVENVENRTGALPPTAPITPRMQGLS